MTAIMSPGSSPATSPPAISSPPPSASHPALPPLITSPPARRSTLPRPMSHASKNRLSQYSTASIPSRSRPPSHIFPIFPSSLSYALVRDFAYPPGHPMHYGPPPEPSRPPSGRTTPASEQRRLSDPPMAWDSKSWDSQSWVTEGSGGFSKAGDLPPIQFADGPPWSEDEDLQSPVVSSRHRKHKSSSGSYGHGRSRSQREVATSQSSQSSSMMNSDNFDHERGYYVGTSGDGSERYYINQGSEANGPGGEYVTYPPDQARHAGNAYQITDQQPRQYANPGAGFDSDESSPSSSPSFQVEDQSRYSRDYQFTITSPDEEMHGKAVALFDFERENENELPLVEGQIIWVSYRHGLGWLVAEDPKTQESGLVPEEYVRLLRDIEGGMNSLTGQLSETPTSPNEVGTPTQAEHQNFGQSPAPSVTTNGYHQPVVSTFSTSSKDLNPYPQHLLGTQTGQAPPQVVHYHGQRGGSQANTPTLLFHQDVGPMRRGSLDTATKKSTDLPGLETLPDVKMESPASSPDSDSKMDLDR
ncbi:hypothetical protein B0T26DRAFT_27599 [Lasiosphaeria miniovina]|uniref:SH3 domain-containing protein n=1 Tax=Lasiosphaeria miniovina TaxID=1954250 RepID=A0AA40EDM1_9PEZI|nr:uncharacterized protein B0T26DRAFT_27599 [Lasiosphaeria miniovina]KAK0733581.1 hypothetical protein B0T26DRAFT_27599 [Lasiosphaeria miniovina]